MDKRKFEHPSSMLFSGTQIPKHIDPDSQLLSMNKAFDLQKRPNAGTHK